VLLEIGVDVAIRATLTTRNKRIDETANKPGFLGHLMLHKVQILVLLMLGSADHSARLAST
jgi:hypothetical protein